MNGEVPIVRTKVLVPRKRPDLLSRARLVDFVHEHIDRKLILISASAGYGKTSLLTDYAHDTDLPVCWYSLDEADRDPTVFLEYLVASIRERFPHFGTRTLGALQGGGRTEGLRPVVGAMVNEIYEVIPDYFALVIDDFHLVSDSDELTSLLSFLLRRLPESCHILLASRTTTPGLPIIELMAHQELAGLGNEDLKFTAYEIRRLLRQNHNLDLPPEEAERLARQSEGWITAILLTTHTLWKGLLRTMARVRGDDSQIFAYLAREVLEHQADEVQSFLKGSSVLQRMTSALCDGLLGLDNSVEMLTLVEDKNLFISRLEGDGEDWFRYHPLFQEFLQAKLREERDLYLNLHLRAGKILEAQESWDWAIRHYLQAEAYERAGRLVEAVAAWAFKSGRWSSLLSWTESLTGKASPSPWIYYWQSKVFTDSGRLDDAIHALEMAKGGFSEREDRLGTARAVLEESYIHRLRAEYDQAIAKAEQVLGMMDGDQESAVVGLALQTLGICHGLQGQLEEGLAQLEEAWRCFERLEDEYNVANTLHDMGTIHLSVDDEKFLDYSRRALAYWRRLGARGPLALTLNNIGVAHYRQGRFDEAMAALQEALVESQAIGLLRPQAYAQATIGDVHRARGDYGSAQQACQEALALAEEASEGFLVSYLWDALGNLERVLGNYEKAEELIGNALEKGYEHGSDQEVAVSLISQGILLHVERRNEEALRTLRQAVGILQKLGLKQELAKAHLHLASVLFSQHQVSQAMLNLEMALDILSDAGVNPLLLDEGTGSRPLLEYVIGERLMGKHVVWLRRLLLRTEPPSEPVEITPDDSSSGTLEFFALGSSVVRRNGKAVEARELRLGAKRMLFFFLAHPSATKEQIVAALWPDLSLATAHSTFHFYLFQVRRLLGGTTAITYEGGAYRLESRGYLYDVEEFQRALAKAEKARGPQRERYLREAVSLYHGHYLEDVYSDWTQGLRASLQRQYFRALEELAGYYYQGGRPEEAVKYYRNLLDRDPLREDIHRQVIRGLALIGDRAGAMRQYEELRRMLAQLGAEPSTETLELYEDLLTGAA
jgi:ATP/maltotriose-dependent transcriptional regulator MalT/DNA-binding SARP family transcriptional activator